MKIRHECEGCKKVFGYIEGSDGYYSLNCGGFGFGIGLSYIKYCPFCGELIGKSIIKNEVK